ncbi:DUF4129 domain-containing protein [Motilimonas eburnea]|uniref:DUF4129 domain-containing protein n=1 Tax=Motilimonas eburnea TaxID=1737488 RepID=UPI001E3DE775|nr:DUF4129 domain-containing protein [Motilimonas eburnea]MCE2571966.1 DUF4129 domain-containing protein [Motilimonas eburnea]
MFNRSSCFYLASALLVAILFVSLDSIALQTQVPEYYKNAINLMLSSPMGVPIIVVMAFAMAGIVFMLFNAQYMRHIVLIYVIGLALFYGFVSLVDHLASAPVEPQEVTSNEAVVEQQRPRRPVEDEAVRGWLKQTLIQEAEKEDTRLTLSSGVILVLMAVIILLILAPRWQQRRQASDSLAETPPPLANLAKQQAKQMQASSSSAKAQIINCYQQLLSLLAQEYKLVRHPAQTAQEFYVQLKQAQLPAEPLYQLTLIFEKACYSQVDFVSEEVAKAITYLDEISQAKS